MPFRVPLPSLPDSWRPGSLSPLLGRLPGARQRRRALLLAALAALLWLLRPWPPFQWLPGWCVGLAVLVAIVELLRWLWWPRRWE